MSGTTNRTRSGSIANRRAAHNPLGALADVRATRGLLAAVLATVLLAAGTLGGVASAAATKPPKVTTQPASQTVEEGQSASFSAAASGNPAPTLRWERSTNGGASWSPIEGATASPLTVASTKTLESGYEFRAVFKSTAGTATSKAATLTVQKAPAVTEQPASTTVEEGQNAVFEATASGFPPPAVQWQTSTNGGGTWSNLAGATSDQLTLTAKTSLSGYEYRAIFKNGAGTATSEAATLTVRLAPSLTKQPLSATIEAGESAVFEATASGFPTPTVQWEISTNGGGAWSVEEGATSDQLTVANAKTSEDGYEYRAVFKNVAGTATSKVATLTVRVLPVVTQEPLSTTVEAGEGAGFEAAASGFPTPTVQWEISTNGGGSWSNVAGATSDQLTLAKTQASESGDEYRAVFTNTAGKAVSNTATLTVATNHYSAVGWGNGSYGQLGDGSDSLSNMPTPVSGLTFVTSVAAGGRHSLALLADGTVVAWGANGYGQLGDGETSMSSVPVAVEGLSGVKAISAGADHSLALLTDGTVMAWGDNESGQLGIGSSVEDVEAPVAVKGLSGVKAISAGADHSLALLTDGTVMAWGENESGQLGDGKTANSSVPVAVKGLSGVAAISAGGEFSLALLAKGTVEAWGSDQQGQLGNSTVEEGASDVPVPVGALTGVTAIAAGAKHGLALLSGGTVMAWGEDKFGELGSGTIKPFEETPVAVSGLSGATAISAGGQDSVALLGSGSVMTWGTDKSGNLGDGVTGGMSDVPVPVIGLRKVASVSAGGFHMLAYGEPIPAIASVSPTLGPAAGGETVTITGVEFTGSTAVKFGTAEAASFTVNSASSITATAPPGTGTVDITVTTPSGISPSTPNDRYTYQFAPTVRKLSAKSGPAAGGTSVTITGTEFTGASAVKFGTAEAASFTVNSATSITAISPAATAGRVNITVTNTSGASAPSKKSRFTYTA
jgi:alpha-tubulin suppressor-like RCC1 family protein